QPQDVKLVGDSDGVREEAADEGPVGVGHVERDDADVLAAGDAAKGRFELGARASLHDRALSVLSASASEAAQGVSILGLYAGIEVIDYLGATSTCGGCSMLSGAQPVQQSRSELLYGFEAGYNFKFSRVTIRPQLGLGDFRLSSAYGDPAPGSVSDVSNYLYLEPGVVGLVSLGVLFDGA
ncbi:MAG: hypothetical protein M3O50_16380, partial [Myxococcota bacterium]|nr:hypothetical protein [Myxococcota bacterium]